MTELRTRKILDAIADCDRYIGKEEPRAADLRPPEVAKRLAFYKNHREKLIAMLANQKQEGKE